MHFSSPWCSSWRDCTSTWTQWIRQGSKSTQNYSSLSVSLARSCAGMYLFWFLTPWHFSSTDRNSSALLSMEKSTWSARRSQCPLNWCVTPTYLSWDSKCSRFSANMVILKATKEKYFWASLTLCFWELEFTGGSWCLHIFLKSTRATSSANRLIKYSF